MPSDIVNVADAISLFFDQVPVEEHEAFLKDVKVKFNITPKIRFSDFHKHYFLDYDHAEVKAFVESGKMFKPEMRYSFAV